MSVKEHGGKGPSVAELEKYVRDKVRLEFFVAKQALFRHFALVRRGRLRAFYRQWRATDTAAK